jgi:hypothetical protein
MLNRNIDLFIIPSFLFRLGFRKSAVDGPILSILPKYFKNKGYFEKKDQSLKKENIWRQKNLQEDTPTLSEVFQGPLLTIQPCHPAPQMARG